MLRPELTDVPGRILALPVHRGYPVPWFVAWKDGAPEFRAMDGEKFVRAVRERRCWVCGEGLGRFLSFVLGPMCAVNRTNAEPPCHHECAVWSAKFCPFLSRPHMVRREDEAINNSMLTDASIPRNPGCAGVWTTKSFRMFKAAGASASGYLFEIGEPTKVEWFAEGREATRAEVERSIDTGLPFLVEACRKETTDQRKVDALLALARMRRAANAYLPLAVAPC